MPIPVESFVFDPRFDGTLQQHIRKLVSDGILSGRFRPGDRLPSSRKLATHLGVSRITVTLAYNELLSGDYLSARDRSGYFVSDNAPQPADFGTAEPAGADTVDWRSAIANPLANVSVPEKPADWRSYPYPFIYGQADDSLFDHRNFRQCALQALGKREFPTVTADFFERDDPKLIEHIASHTLPRRGIAARPEQILLTLGAQNALWLCAQLLLDHRGTAVMENPGYPGLRLVLEQRGCRVVPLDVDGDGLLPDAIPRGADVVFVTPSHHCPTGVTLSMERRNALLERAARDDFLVVEDDYEFEMPFARSPAPALKSLDHDGRVIHIGSFSKSMFPGLRLGYVVGAAPFIRELRKLRAAVLRHPPGQVQRTVANFLSLGHYDSLIARMRKAFRERREIMAAAIAEHGLVMASTPVSGGSSFWMKAHAGTDTDVLAQALKEKGVLIEPGHVFFQGSRVPCDHYRLAYSSIDTKRIAPGIALIAEALDKPGPMGQE